MVKANAAMAPVIFGCEGLTLSAKEQAFFADVNPLGFILFARNCDNPDQVKALIKSLRKSIDSPNAPVLIDQEGGRVARLTPPHWRAAPAPAVFAKRAERSKDQAVQAAKLNAHMMAMELSVLGISVDCTPVLDIPKPGADPIIGDRALGTKPDIVAALGRAVCDGMMAGGVLPVIKHVPGHGRANADSHKALPVVETPVDELKRSDFAPFHALRDMPWAMTAHVLYTNLDSKYPATTSKTVIDDIIRGEIGFQGVLLSDDLSMQALSGSMEDRTRACLDAGCDIVLHCNGDMTEMVPIAQACGAISDETLKRLQDSAPFANKTEAINLAEAEEKLAQLLEQ